jgi:hypothetical protein
VKIKCDRCKKVHTLDEVFYSESELLRFHKQGNPIIHNCDCGRKINCYKNMHEESKPKDTGGPAYPEVCNDQIIPGMTPRDYFASHSPYGIEQALDAVKGGRENRASNDFASFEELSEAMAKINYFYADAMIKESQKT